ncbi:MAG: hypothetical protein BGO90_04030 [Legionella sp. 40-6]|nr:hypothetical protein [Legionella sp.]OJY39722.1 MAG: hypothetical protein BGO90_04030 [Legionella sp. 40-6]
MAQLNDPYQGKLPAKEIQKLITEFNAVPEGNHLHRIFLLHKINNLLNTVSYDQKLFEWVNQVDTVDGSWGKTLKEYGINPVASFFIKNHQFAQAASANCEHVAGINQPQNLYEALQSRDALLVKSPTTDADMSRYGQLSVYIQENIDKTPQFKETLERHTEVLNIVQDKINIIRGQVNPSTADYKYQTQKLGENSNNNYNFVLKVKDEKNASLKKLVIRVEDRNSLSVEQKLHSYEVSKYFGDDAALFTMAMKEDGRVVYKPIVVSHFANAGDLQNLARNLKKEQKSITEIISTATHYFQRLVHFCQTLKEADTYHPDIKLTNFLVHNNMIRVCDRKTFVTEDKLLVKNIRSSPLYSPPQYYQCITGFGLNFKAQTTEVDMNKFMSYQIGMAFKEFLILTQQEDIPRNFQNSNASILDSFDPEHYNNALFNFDYLIKALTRDEESLRLSLAHLPKLLLSIKSAPQKFIYQLKEIAQIPEDPLHAQISEEIKSLSTEKNPSTLLDKANQLFERVAAQNYFSNQMIGSEIKNLAMECAQILFKGPRAYWSDYLVQRDLAQASATERFTHWISRATVRVPHRTTFSNIADEKIAHSLYYQSKLCTGLEIGRHLMPKNNSDLNHLLHLELLHSELKRKSGNNELSREQFTDLLKCTGNNVGQFYNALQQIIPYTSLNVDPDAVILHDRLVALLNDKVLDPAQRLIQANQLFNLVSNEYTEDHRIKWLASALANQCFQEYSISKFRDLSNQLEHKLDTENWKRASFLDKFKYYLSFGTRPVPKVVEISEVQDQINVDHRAFLPHLLTTIFIADKTLAFHLGHKQYQHLKQYLDTQAGTFNQLLQGNAPIDSQSSSLKSQGTNASNTPVAQNSTFIAHSSSTSISQQTMVINTVTSASNSQNGTVVINPLPTQSTSLTQSANATVVFKSVSQIPSTAVNSVNSSNSNTNSSTNTLLIKNSSRNTQPNSLPHKASLSQAKPALAGRLNFFTESVQETVKKGDRYSDSFNSRSLPRSKN